MIARNELRKIAHTRLKEAEVLYQNKKYDGAIYLCGYAVEAVLKSRICRTLKWTGFPQSRSEFQSYQSFRTHDLDILLNLSGIEAKILDQYPAQWAIAKKWSPEMRYHPIGTAIQSDVFNMIEASKVLVKVI